MTVLKRPSLFASVALFVVSIVLCTSKLSSAARSDGDAVEYANAFYPVHDRGGILLDVQQSKREEQFMRDDLNHLAKGGWRVKGFQINVASGTTEYFYLLERGR